MWLIILSVQKSEKRGKEKPQAQNLETLHGQQQNVSSIRTFSGQKVLNPIAASKSGINISNEFYNTVLR
jgi:hypothetical protein